MREEQQTAVWPRLVVATGYNQGERVSFLVANRGIGPAVIRSVTASVDGRSVSDWPSVFNALTGEDRGWHVSMSYIGRGEIIPAGEKVTAFDLRDSIMADRIARKLDHLRFDMCYCSVYGRCWVTSARDAAPEPRSVRDCPPSKAEFTN